MRSALRGVLVGLLAATLVAGVLGAGLYVYLRQSLPRTSGEIELSGLRSRAEILRDAYGIPHIYAASVEDAHFALGFVHAQDRLWQMEINRRLGSGRLAEVLGPAALETDRFIRTLGVRRVAEANLARYDGETRAVLDAYAAGVNAFLAEQHVLPPEFLLTGARPEPWSAADSIVWTKMMAWDLGGNWRAELLRLRLAKTLAGGRVQEFLPPYPGDAPPDLPDLKTFYAGLGAAATRLAERFGFDDGAPLGSNSWVVDGARSASGKPLLANDPHLGLAAPSVWYLAHLNAPGLDVIGGTLPGVPGVVLGRNQRIAWGFTNTGPDVQDLFLEKIDAAGNYLSPEGARPFETVKETIRVKGAPDETLTVRLSRHGPVISDVLRVAREAAPAGHAIALQWTALAADDATLQAALKVARAGDWNAFLAAARDYHAPQQNIVYADIDGNIGFVAPGRVPVRKAGNDLKGLAPAPGWDARYDWAGYVPFEELPRLHNPPVHAIVTANHKITPPGYRHHLTYEWQPPYRARRIAALLDASGAHSVHSFARMQGDVVSLPVQELLPRFLAAAPRDAASAQALKMLAGWDGSMSGDRPEPLIFVAWWRELARRVYADELGDAFARNWSTRPVFLDNVLADRQGQARWCDDVRTAARESCADLLAESLAAALADLRRRYGDEPARWRWGEAHAAHHAHRPLSRVRWLAQLLDFRVPTAGDAYSINVGRSDFEDERAPFENRHAASLRAIYDFADLEASLFIHSGGQSGNPLSAHYRAFAEAWARVEYVPMTTDRRRLEAGGVQRLVLRPR